jgi:hypothetical protein
MASKKQGTKAPALDEGGVGEAFVMLYQICLD